MNERIKKLAEQAGFCMWKDEPWNPGDVIDWSCRYDKELEKFAELIIKDCDQYARCYWEHGELLGGDLKRHFGVEQ